MNTVRKHISQIKEGGSQDGLTLQPFLPLFLSDVVGDPLDVIASGPTVPDPSTFEGGVGDF